MSVHIHPKLAVATGCFLAFLSAGVNACYLIGLGTSVSHLTGDVSRVALNVVEGHEALSLAVFNLVSATFGFVSGATLAGFFIHHPSIEFTRPYGRAVLAIGVCLAAAHFAFGHAPIASIGIAGLACGFQNALATHYRGIILRTTHVTGILTDLGTNLGMLLKGHQIALWKLSVPVFLVISFFAGSLAGCMAFIMLPRKALLFYALLYMGLGGLWIAFRYFFILRRSRSS